MATVTDSSVKPKHTVHWFRKGLRLHDNPALREGIRDSTTFRCIYILDPYFAGSSQLQVNKWKFLLESLEDLDCSLRELGSRLFVVRGQPADVLPKLFKEWDTTTLTFEEDPELFGRERDVVITALAKAHGVHTVTRISHTLYDMQSIVEHNGGKHPLTYRQFQSVISGMDLPPHAEETVDAELIGTSITPISADHDKHYSIPTLKELGFEMEGVKTTSFKGGESEALVRMLRHLERKAFIANNEKPKLGPLSLFPSETGLSPYLQFGCLSARHFYWNLRELYTEIKKDDRPSMALHGQLLWREFFYMVATVSNKFDQMQGNPICVQIPWDTNSEALAKWAEGKTGFPWIDAIMTQLRQEGWIHSLCRHAVASFLTRGDLWQSWEEGMKLFDELMLDVGCSVNAGTWLWQSGSSFFQQFFHTYCPVGFGKQADPTGDYVRHYLPELKGFPTKYIYEPWTAPESVQKAANCMIGKDYPCPMVNHAEVSDVNMHRMKQVYQQLNINANIQLPRYIGGPLTKKTKMPLQESGILNKPRQLNYAAGEKDFKIQKKACVHAIENAE